MEKLTKELHKEHGKKNKEQGHPQGEKNILRNEGKRPRDSTE